jgi:hypothetical protein
MSYIRSNITYNSDTDQYDTFIFRSYYYFSEYCEKASFNTLREAKQHIYNSVNNIVINSQIST